LHIKGSWRCAPQPAPSPFAAKTCGDFYDFAQLTRDQVQALAAAGACHGQSIGISGALKAHVANALDGRVQDLSTTAKCGVQPGDNSYFADLYFASAGQGYLLQIHQIRDRFQDAAFAPGEFPATHHNPASGGSLTTDVQLSVLKTNMPGNFSPLTDIRVQPWLSTGGTYTVGQDLTSGTVNLDLSDYTDPSDNIHLSGSWRCAE
jgi:hypothetical protein